MDTTATTLDDFPARRQSTAPLAWPPPSPGGVRLDADEEAAQRRAEHDADVEAYWAWQGRVSAWLRNPIGPCPE